MKKEHGFSLIELLIVVAIVGIILAIIFSNSSGCSSQMDYATRATEHFRAEGYTGITVVNTCFIGCGCGDDDGMAYILQGTDRDCNIVQATVCLGTWKEPTTRGKKIVRKAPCANGNTNTPPPASPPMQNSNQSQVPPRTNPILKNGG